jgi:hypothetical protein
VIQLGKDLIMLYSFPDMHKVFDEESTQGYKDSMKNIEAEWLSHYQRRSHQSVSDPKRTDRLYSIREV